MTEQYLRIDGVNHAAVMEDTTQLSVIRGGSFLLREAVKYVAANYRQSLKALSIEASSGLFQVLSDDAKGLRDQIADALTEHEQFRHFTFVVDVQSDEGDLAKALASVTARNRFRQMRQLSIALPPWNDQAFAPCELDDRRPGDGRVEVKRDRGLEWVKVSRSVEVRHHHGRTQKQAFYRNEAKKNGVVDPSIARLNYTRELDEIATGSRFRDLENKLAVMYLDGNKFGSIPAERARQHPGTAGSAEIERFDVELRRYRSEFLRRFLLEIADDPDFRAGDGRLRIETLLWGGDELTFVLPAWKGFWALNWFYEHSSEWNYHGIPLTHAGGLVFCHYKTPIFRVRNLANKLADAVKGHLDGERQNQFEYSVLESIDFPTEPLKRFWARRYGALADNRRPLPPITAWDVERGKLQALLKDKKGQLHALVEKAIAGRERAFAEQRSRFAEVLGPSTFELLQATVERLFPSESQRGVWPWIRALGLPHAGGTSRVLRGPMIACRYTVTVTVRAPIFSQATGGRTLGIDAGALRHAGRPALPGSLIRGNLRHAWEYFADSGPSVDGVPSREEIKGWLGKPSEEQPEDAARNNDEPRRARLQFAAYWVAREEGGHGKRHRIKIDPKSGTVEPRHLQIIEAPFASGSDVLYEGHIDALCRDASEGESLGRWIRKGLEFTPALGAFKGAGFGRIVAVKVASERRALPTVTSPPAVAERFGIRLTLDRPFCFARPHPPKTNRYESQDFIPGGAILGAMARHVFPDGRDNLYSDDRWKPLRDAFHQIRITHARPGKKAGGTRPLVIPQSLVFDPQEKVPKPYDVALKCGPVLINGHAPIFQVDWKPGHWMAAGSLAGCQDLPERAIIVRTEIDKKTGAALESALFAVEAVRPDGHDWLAEVDLTRVTSNRDHVGACLRELLLQGLDMLGKTKAVARVEVLETPPSLTTPSRETLVSHHFDNGEQANLAVVTLQSAARLLPKLRDIPATNGDEVLKNAYAAAWAGLSAGQLELLWYYARQQLVGGQYLWRRFGKHRRPYNPEVLTTPGSVFVLKLAGDSTIAEERLSEWLSHGLPQPADAPGGEDWQETPYIRNNGYGEVAINLALHWHQEPKSEVCDAFDRN